MKEGHIDAFGQGGAPAAGIVELAATEDIVVIPFTKEEIDKICQVAPYFRPGVMQANIYRGQDTEIPLFTFVVYWIAHKDVPADVVYDMLKVAFDHVDDLTTVHPLWRQLAPNLEGFSALGIPLHPGAVKYWTEKGRTIPANIRG